MAGQLPLDLAETPRDWSVAELGAELHRLVRGNFPAEVWVHGELRNLRTRERGNGRNLFFDLVEPGAGLHRKPDAAFRVVLWDDQRRDVNATLRAAGPTVKMDEGVELKIRAKVEWWRRTGDLRLVMQGIDPVFTLGRLAADRERLLRELDAAGLLHANRSRAMPVLPLRIGLVTAQGSAAEIDVLHELEASGLAFEVCAVDSPVQGPYAPPRVVLALATLATRAVDVILLVRGGGARTDLAAFDHPAIAHAIARSPVPVLTGVGHEIDRSVADEVAHTSAKTPTAAAACVVARARDAQASLDRRWALASAAALDHLAGSQRRLATVAERAATRSLASLQRAASRCGDHERRVTAAAERLLRQETRRLDRLAARVPTLAAGQLERAGERLAHTERQVHALDPARLVARGWSITRDADGRVVRRATAVARGDHLTTTLAGGRVVSRAESIEPSEEGSDA